MNESLLYELLARAKEHLPDGDVKHYHVVASADNESEWERSGFLASPPYRERSLAEKDAADPGLLAKAGNRDVSVLECSRRCPRSARGNFGWGDEAADQGHWWDPWG